MKQYDLIIIGGGAGAFAAAIRANELEVKTVIINAGLPIGGTCVNVGCVPSKTLLWAGELLHTAKHHDIPGVELEVKNFDFQKVVEDERALVEHLRVEKYEKVLKNLEHVTLIEGRATFTSSNEVEVNGEKLSAEKFVIAVGSTANVPPIEGIKEVGYLSHIEALKLKQQYMKSVTHTRPWGSFIEFTKNKLSTVKIIIVKEGEELSLQYHKNREEFWRVLSSTPTVAIGDEEIVVKEGDEFFVKAGEKHRISAKSQEVQILEISFGQFNEDDIVRIKDKYGRVN